MRHVVGNSLDYGVSQFAELEFVKCPDVHDAVARVSMRGEPVITFSKINVPFPDLVMADLRDDTEALTAFRMSNQIVLF